MYQKLLKLVPFDIFLDMVHNTGKTAVTFNYKFNKQYEKLHCWKIHRQTKLLCKTRLNSKQHKTTM